MDTYYLHIKDGVEGETSIDAASDHDALNTALNAMSQFACKRFPPPDNIEISVMNASRKHLATLRFVFSIQIAQDLKQ